MRRSGLKIMMKLIGLVRPLFLWMVIAIFLGVLGYLAAIAIVPLAFEALLTIFNRPSLLSLKTALILTMVSSIARGFLRYGEQYCNHTIAFRLLALIRHEVFQKLASLAPAKLEGKDKGALISTVTSDIELLEVFYAHTISPIAIAVITCFILVLFEAWLNPFLGLFSLFSYLIVGLVLPLAFGKKGKEAGMNCRNKIADCNSFFLDTLRGIKPIIQFDYQQERLDEFLNQIDELEKDQLKLKKLEGSNQSITSGCVMLLSVLAFILSSYLILNQQVSFEKGMLGVILLFGSFGPTVALSNLSNNLHHTLASAQRVLSLLEEKAGIDEIHHQAWVDFKDAKVNQVSFGYQEEMILNDFSLNIEQGKIVGLLGKSGSGKSTLIKLLMRFYKPKKGELSISGTSLEKINTDNLRKLESYVTQETVIFNDTIFENIAFVKENVTLDEVKEACRKASIDEWIESLSEGYNSKAMELGEALSGGEKQRIALARAFLHDAPFFLLDEPTSNLDSLNEAVILNSLKEEAKKKTILIVSHRPSTLSIADHIIQMDTERSS